MEWITLVCLLLSAMWDLSVCFHHQYHFVNMNKTWNEAQSYCRQNYADLATINNMEEMNNLINMLKGKATDYVLIGLRRGGDGAWRWSDGSDSRFRNWKQGQPRTVNDCAALTMEDINTAGQWEDWFCSNFPRPFVCYENPLILIKLNLTWIEAMTYCREHHVDLVSVDSKQMQQWVMAAAVDASTPHVWLGLLQGCPEGLWFWVTGNGTCYSNWAPQNWTSPLLTCSYGGNTGAIQSGGQQQWVSLPHYQTLNFICTKF